jgi:hypothetical protein
MAPQAAPPVPAGGSERAPQPVVPVEAPAPKEDPAAKPAPPEGGAASPGTSSDAESEKTVDELVGKLMSAGESWQARAAAARALGRLGSAAADACGPLVETLAEDRDELTYSAYQALRHIGDASVPVLVEGMRHGKSMIHRQRCARALMSFRDAARAILPLLKDPDRDTRYVGTEAMSRVSPPSKDALPLFFELLADPHFETARAAARGLVALRPYSLPGLEEKKKSPNEQVRSLAEFSLRSIGEKGKTPASASSPTVPPKGTVPPVEEVRARLSGSVSAPSGPAAGASADPAPAARGPNSGGTEERPSAAVVPPPQTAVGSASEPFVDVTAARGISFRHQNGATAAKLMPETVGAGAAWLDFDGDGYLDLYLVQGHRRLAAALDGPAPGSEPGNVLLRSVPAPRPDGGGIRFEDVSARAGVDDRGYGMGAAAGDYDNDGWPDLYVTNFGKNVLYHNERNSTFRDVTREAGVEGGGWSTSAAWADLDGDGLLDLYLDRYVAYDPRNATPCTKRLPGRDGKMVQIYCYPEQFSGTPDILFRNLGGGKFAEIGAEDRIGRLGGLHEGKSLGVLVSDYDNDGDPDVLVTNDTTPNNLWRNLGGLRFEEVGLEVGFALPEDAKARAGMGIDRGDVDGDGRLDYLVTNFTRETNTLYLNRAQFFEDGTRASGMSEASYLPLGFGVRFTDYDLDGDLDLYVTNGHVLDNARQVEGEGSAGFEQEDSLYQNDGRGRFKSVGPISGAWFRQKHVGRGVAEADFDNDGDGDLLITHNGGPAVLLENRAGDGKPWIGIDLRPGSAGPQVIGARVEVEAGQSRWVREYATDGSYLVSNDPRIRIGLGSLSPTDLQKKVAVRVRWPGTREFQTFTGLEPGRYHLLRRDGATGR